jgi:hypothetical protein
MMYKSLFLEHLNMVQCSDDFLSGQKINQNPLFSIQRIVSVIFTAETVILTYFFFEGAA